MLKIGCVYKITQTIGPDLIKGMLITILGPPKYEKPYTYFKISTINGVQDLKIAPGFPMVFFEEIHLVNKI
jgi:hypothetical protein